MKKILLAALAFLLVVALGAVGYGVHLVRRLDTPEFQKELLDQARAALGTDVRVERMDISLLSGVTLEGITVSNPSPFQGDLLTADAFFLRYRLRPLLSGRVEIERLSLEKPKVDLVMDKKGAFNYERLGSRSTSTSPAAATAAPAVPLKVVLSRLSVENAAITMTDARQERLLSVEDAGFSSRFEVEGGVARGSGEARIAAVDVGSLLFVRDVSAPISVSKEELSLAPIRARVAGGRATGDLKVRLKDFRYETHLDVEGASVKTLLQEAQSAAGITGTLQGQATFAGEGGLPTMTGRGQATIADCRVEHARVLALLSTVLQVEELANPDFEECRTEFELAGTRLSTPVLSLKGPAIQLSGKGRMNLETLAIDYAMSLALSPKLLAKVTRPELRPAFKERGDGFSAVDFRVYGTTLEPQTDLLARVGKAAATQAAKDQVNKLFKKKIF
jgi:uncharacterized protein YhdP